MCKGNFPIADGAPVTTFYGKGVALAGMKTACGAVLIATQFTDVVEVGGGSTSGSSMAAQQQRGSPAEVGAPSRESQPATSRIEDSDESDLEQYFQAVDANGIPVDLIYRINSGSTKLAESAFLQDGATKAVPADLDVQLVFWRAPT
jgi:hypothetical protein